MKRIKVTGYMLIEDDEYDGGPLGPLNEQMFNETNSALSLLDEVEYELAEDDDD